MHGLFGTIGDNVFWDFSQFTQKRYEQRAYDDGLFRIHQITLPKFLKDKYFYSKDGCFLATEGVLFEANTPADAITCYKQGETAFWNSWRGSFAGILYDAKQETLLIFNDHIGSKMLFYAQTKNGLIFASDPYLLAKAIGAKPDNENFIWQMLIYGYSPVGETPFKCIQRLLAGEYLYVKGKKVERCIYHRFKNTPNDLSIEENIERIDVAFRKAVERGIRKNEEYGYTHYLPLSAGLDSRMPRPGGCRTG